MADEVKVVEAPDCEAGLSEFESRLSPQNNCPFCVISCGKDWCTYTCTLSSAE